MKRFALIGYPVDGSLSPRLFEAAYEGRYPYDLVGDPSFDRCWERFLADYSGINVTAPFKQNAFRAVDGLSRNARLAGAVNLVTRENGYLHGYNTDVDGVVHSVQECGLPVSRALVVGTGGAGRAAAVAAGMLGCEVSVVNRTLGNARELKGIDLVLYTLPVAVPALPDWSSAVVLEANYRTPGLSDIPCRAYISGRRWLLHQAAAGYALFTGEEPNVEKMSEIIATSM